MKIIKYSKKNSSIYKVMLENNDVLELHENVILNNELLLKKEIDDLDKLLKENQKYEIYDNALKYINHKLRSVCEMEKYLVNKNYLKDDIKWVIDELLDKKYLNDELYAKCYINDRINLSNDGPRKIINYLESQNISYNIYGKYLNLFEQEIIDEKISKYINKMVKTNKKSRYVLKNKIYMNLINLGYDKEDINRSLEMINLGDEQDNYEVQKEKLYKKLSRKYTGKELEQKVKEKLYQLGYFKGDL